MKHFVLIAFVLTLISTPLLAQSGGGEIVPDAVMRQVVDRVVRYHIKEPLDPKTIYISERNIKEKWLPKIRNIKFVLIKDDQLANKPKGYIFYKVDSGDRYSFMFGFGDLNPGGYLSGSFWFAELKGRKLKIYRDSNGWGTGSD